MIDSKINFLSEEEKKFLKLNHKALKVGFVITRWYGELTEQIYEQAKEELSLWGIEKQNIQKWEVPGSFELIYACDKICKSQKLDVILAIGVLIKGETMHFEYISEALSQGLKEINLRHNTPTIFGILTTNTPEQAKKRAAENAKGWAQSALCMACLKKSLEI